jgi:hypothetical protein
MTTHKLTPTDDQIESACLSYRHDFGLLELAEQSKIKYAGLEWLLAWQKAMPALGDTEAAIAAAVTRAVDFCDKHDFHYDGLDSAVGEILQSIARAPLSWEEPKP